jgi:hypothetical protein
MDLAKPPALTPIVILAEVGAAILGGLLLAPIFGYGAMFLFSGAGLGMGLLSVAVFAAVIGFGAGGGAGAAIAGRALCQRGSPWLAVLGGGLSGVIVILVLRLLNINVGGLFGIAGVGVPIVLAVAVLCYNLRRGSGAESREPGTGS